MSSRSDIGRGIQIGRETTSGVPVAAGKLFASLGIDMNFEGEIKTYTPQGLKFDGSSSLQRSWQKGSYDGAMTYTELIYPLSSLYGAITPTTPAGGTLSRNWTWLPAPTGADTPQTFTVEEGDAAAATQYPGVIFTSLSLAFGMKDLSVKGGILGQTGNATTLTANPTVLRQKVATANQVDVFIADTYTDDATFFADGNKITDAYEEMFDIADKYDPRFVHNTAFNSYKDVTEKRAQLKFTFKTEFNAQARALYTAALRNAFRYVGVRVRGDVIEGTIRESILLVAACNVTPAKRDNADGVWGYEFNAMPIYDAALGSAFKISVTNSVTAL